MLLGIIGIIIGAAVILGVGPLKAYPLPPRIVIGVIIIAFSIAEWVGVLSEWGIV